MQKISKDASKATIANRPPLLQQSKIQFIFRFVQQWAGHVQTAAIQEKNNQLKSAQDGKVEEEFQKPFNKSFEIFSGRSF